MEQLSLFDDVLQEFKIDKPIRLIELFAGYGSQALALKYLGLKFEHYKICEWAVKSIQAYKDIHFTNDNTDYTYLLDNYACNESDDIEIKIEWYLLEKGISMNYNEPMTIKQIHKLGYEKQKQIFNNIQTTHNLVDISKVKGIDLEIKDTETFTYLLTYSFPCQDLSLAGKGKGMKRDSGTRSGMLWEVERILKELKQLGTLPQILLMENVPQVIGTKNIKDFQDWKLFLESLGYSNYVELLNAKDYGIPQNRERAFMISILGDYKYDFPKPFELKLRLKDMLEENVDESYYLSDKMISFFYNNNNKQIEKGNGFRSEPQAGEKVAKCITTRCGSRMDDNFIIQDFKNKALEETLQQNELDEYQYIDTYNKNIRNDNISGTITTRVNDSNNTYVCVPINDTRNAKEKFCDELIEKNIVKEGDVINHSYCEHRKDCFHIENSEFHDCFGTLTTRPDTLGIVIKKDTPNYIEWEQQGRLDIDCRAYKENTIAPTTTTTPLNKVLLNNLRIRKLTPKECGRLMGVKDEDIDKLTLSKSAQYHCFGDSICTTVLMAIFGQFTNLKWEEKLWNIKKYTKMEDI